MTYEEWQQGRRDELTSATGNLAMIGYLPVSENKPVQIPSLPATVALAPDRAGVLIAAAAESRVTINGTLVDGTAVVSSSDHERAIISWGHYSVDVFAFDGSDYELQIYDSHGSNLAYFDHIEYYDENPNLILPAIYRSHPTPELVAWDFSRSSDSKHTKQVPGILDVSFAGRDYQLLAFTHGPEMVLVFSDDTTGRESYAPGRFLQVPTPDSTTTVTLDFNRAFIPPCGFSEYYSCPIPPPENRIQAPLRGGEKKVHWRHPRH